MIDSRAETLLSLAEAANSLPKCRGRKPRHVSCVYRWTVGGCRGVVLESIQIGGTRCTSLEALARFFEALSAASPVPSAQGRTPAIRERDARNARKELRSAIPGI